MLLITTLDICLKFENNSTDAKKILLAKYTTDLQVSGLCGRPSAAGKDWMNTCLCFTLTNHIDLCIRPKKLVTLYSY